MNGFAQLYGHSGQQADGDPQVAELLKRTVDNQYQATTMFDSAVAEFRDNHPWSAAIPSMAVTHGQWLSAMFWQLATSYLDGVVNTYGEQGQLPIQVVKECDSLCDLATRQTLQAVKLATDFDHGGRPPLATLVAFPSLDQGGPGYEGVWRSCEAVWIQVTSDLRFLDSLTVPSPMTEVYRDVQASFRSHQRVFQYLQTSWATTASAENRKQVVEEAWPIANALFTTGQQLWTPYLLGNPYKEARNKKPTLETLELGFDPWILTDPQQHKVQSKNPDSQAELLDFWQSIQDPSIAIRLDQEIKEALKTRKLRRRTGHGYNIIPWPSQYLVHSPVTIGSRTFKVGDLVAYYASSIEGGKYILEVRRTGGLTNIFDLLGQAP